MKPIIPSLNNISPSSSTSLAFNSYSREASLHLHFILFSFSFDSRVTSQSYNILFPSLFLYNKFFNLFFKISIQCWKQILIPKRFSASVSFSLVSIPSAKPRFFHSLPALNHCYWLKGRCNRLIFIFWTVVQVKSKLVNGGGVDAVQYSENCTHVIVDKIVYVSN